MNPLAEKTSFWKADVGAVREALGLVKVPKREGGEAPEREPSNVGFLPLLLVLVSFLLL